MAFFSQSGALGTAILDWAAANQVGFSAFVSVGCMSDVDFGDLIDYFGADPHTSSIIIYIESITDARKFMSAARHFAKTKPIIVVKSGRTARSAMAAASHTGAIAGDDTLYSAVFRRAGVVRVDEIEDLFDASEALSRQTSPRGPQLGIVTNAGGPGVMATDRLLALGGELAELSPETDAALARACPSSPPAATRSTSAATPDAERYATATSALMSDPNCDGVVAILTPQAMSDPTSTARSLVDVAQATSPQAAADLVHGRDQGRRRRQDLPQPTCPRSTRPKTPCAPTCTCTSTPSNLANLYETPTDILPDFQPNRQRGQGHLHRRGPRADARSSPRSKPSTCSRPTRSRWSRRWSRRPPRSARRRPRRSAFPVAIKILSHDITHKSDVGGIALNVRSAPEAANQFTKILERVKEAEPKAKIIGVAVEAMSRGGYEVIIGSKRDRDLRPGAHVRHGRHRRRALPRRGGRLPAAQPGAGASR